MHSENTPLQSYPLTWHEKDANVLSGPEVSPEALSGLIARCTADPSNPDELALYVRIKTLGVDAFFRQSPGLLVSQGAFLEKYLECGNATEAAQGTTDRSPQTARLWARVFLAFVGAWLERERQYRRDDDARRVACEESCGRKKFPTSSGTGVLTKGAKTRKLDHPDWTRCMDCPSKRIDVDVATRGPGCDAPNGRQPARPVPVVEALPKASKKRKPRA